MFNAGRLDKRISIMKVVTTKNERGFPVKSKELILQPYAEVKTTSGFTLITSGTDFEKAYTRFTIRYPKTQITRDMTIEYSGKEYTIEYLNDVDESGVFLEIQAKEVTH